ncbi:MAG: hypothetical protein KatS3mg132_071 [Limisphaera sp.]|nr:MAG: hypothetical protein KatS3mg132_071 [Limisphaera sp.]
MLSDHPAGTAARGVGLTTPVKTHPVWHAARAAGVRVELRGT